MTSLKTLALATVGAAGLALTVAPLSASACDVTSPTDTSCGLANVNPANPLSINNPSNPASPLSPLNPSNPANPMNPANPASPLNINNPANPASPLNPANQWANNPSNPANPLSPFNPANQPSYGYDATPAYGSGGIIGALLGIEPPAPGPASVVTPDDGYEPEDALIMHRRHHHRRHRHAE